MLNRARIQPFHSLDRVGLLMKNAYKPDTMLKNHNTRCLSTTCSRSASPISLPHINKRERSQISINIGSLDRNASSSSISNSNQPKNTQNSESNNPPSSDSVNEQSKGINESESNSSSKDKNRLDISEILDPDYTSPKVSASTEEPNTRLESTLIDDMIADAVEKKQNESESEEETESEEEKESDAVLQSEYHSQLYYFDTFKIYTTLRFSGFTEGQADVILRAIRDMLGARLEECKEEGVPTTGVDNEAYLFEAACSELKTEVQKMREMQGADYMGNLARLQRDVEITQQELNEYMTTLKSGMDLDINDHKNATKEEEALVHLEIQELHNKIAIEIISDLKSEIEALRWQTTRRGLAAVIFVASAVLVSLSASKKEESAAKAISAHKKTKDNVEEFQVPVLNPPAEDVSFDETIKVPSLGEMLLKDGPRNGSTKSAH